MWKKADLHYHTFSDDLKARQEKLINYQKVIDTSNSEEVNLIAITDHDKISFDAIRKYEEYISSKNYDINVLPGIELGFSFTKKQVIHKGDLILIFNPEKINELKTKEKIIFGDYKKHCPFKSEFKNIVGKLKENKIEFISMPHFNKGAKNIDHKIFDEDYAETIISFDFLEGKYITPKDIKSVERAIDIIENGFESSKATGVKKINLMGTDASSFEDFQKNILKIPWLYNIKNFTTLKKLSTFGSNRVRFGDKPSVADKYIKYINYKEDNGEWVKLNLSRGLNTIIGRRGTGKTFSVDKISSLKKYENISIAKTDNLKEDDINYLKQNILAQNIKSAIEYLYSKKSSIVTFKEMQIDTSKFAEYVVDLKRNRNFLVNEFNKLYSTFYNVNKNNSIIETNKISIKIISNFIELMKKNDNKEAIELLKNDTKTISEISLKNNSNWLKAKMQEIKKELENFANQKKYSINTNNREVSMYLQIALDKFKETEKGKLSISAIISPKEIIKRVKVLNNLAKKLKNDFLFYKEKYRKHSQNYEYLNVDYKMSKDKKITLKPTFKLKSEISLQIFISEIIKKEFKNITNSIGCIKDLLLLSKREKNYNESNLFDVENHYFIEGERIDNKSVGTQHEYFVNKFLVESKEVLILDQPDDDLDSITVKEQIISKINKWNFTKQLIIVTHDPKIVINADSQNIILANYNGDKEFGKYTYKNISEDELKQFAHKIIDGLKKYPYKRYKRYGGYDENN